MEANGWLFFKFGDIHKFTFVFVDFSELVHLLQHLLVNILLPLQRLLFLVGGQLVESETLLF